MRHFHQNQTCILLLLLKRVSATSLNKRSFSKLGGIREGTFRKLKPRITRNLISTRIFYLPSSLCLKFYQTNITHWTKYFNKCYITHQAGIRQRSLKTNIKMYISQIACEIPQTLYFKSQYVSCSTMTLLQKEKKIDLRE